jgi:NADH-quinone oxidoreductase subunit N
MSFTIPDINLYTIAPALIVSICAMVVLLAELFTAQSQKYLLGYLSILGLAIAAFVAVGQWGVRASGFRDMVVVDNFGLFLTLAILVGAAISILMSIPFVRAHSIDRGEYYVLILASVAGMIIMATATDLMVMFLGLELLSLPLYVLAAFQRNENKSLEAGVKYFLLGAFASAFFLYGIALLFGATGTTNLARIADVLSKSKADPTLLLVGAGLLIAGFAFKVALVPFHWWTPDVYEGAPTTITAFMSVGVKAAAFGAFFRTFQIALPSIALDWRDTLAFISIVTMTLGNVAALLQPNIKRMLAYSSIAHAGYILIALVATGDRGVSGALFYILAYTLTNLGAFAAVIALSDGVRERLTVSDFGGAAKQHPLIALALTICMLSLAGFPPFGGFIGKFLIFSAAVETGYTWLAIVAVLNSMISVYFYLRPVVAMYMSEPASGWDKIRPVPALVAIALVIVVIGVIALGIFPSPIIAFAQVGLK